jgi:hypothetical protein
LRRAPRHTHHHGQTRDVGQRFVGQTAGRKARRDQYGEGRGCRSGRSGWPGRGRSCVHRCSSSSLSVRASASSSTGMPSRTG